MNRIKTKAHAANCITERSNDITELKMWMLMLLYLYSLDSRLSKRIDFEI